MRRRFAFVMAGLMAGFLAGCGADLPDSGSSGSTSAEGPSGLAALFSRAEPAEDKTATKRPRLPTPLTKMPLAGGALVVVPPDGYCIDPTTRQRNFALIASCQILTGGRAGASVAPMIATVTVGMRADGLPDPGTIGEAAGAVLLASGREANLVSAHLASGGQEAMPNGDARYWRGVFTRAGRSVGLAVYGPKGSAIAGSEGAAMLRSLRDGITETRPSEDTETTLRLPGALGRLLGR